MGEFTFLQGSSAPDYTANTTIDFKGVAARCVRLVVNSSWDTFGVHGLSEVRFLYIPTRARKPRPESGAEGVDTDVVLTWRAGRDAVSHEVYFGTDEQAVADGTVPVDIVATSAYGPGALDLETTYHWKINEVNEAEPVVLWAGDVWHFTTQDSFVVDDFESYSGGDGHEIFNTWRDGYNDDTNGSQAGHDDPPYVEQTAVHGGGKSMPLYYGKGGVSHSEATRTFEPPQDWTRGGAQVLVLYFQGQSDNTTGQLYLRINDTEVPYDGDPADLAEPSWTQWTVDLSAREVSSVTTLSIGVDGSLAKGRVYVDDIALYRLAPSVNNGQ